MARFFFTFGSDHTSENGDPLRNRYVEIECLSREEARRTMFAVRGSAWAMEYPEDSFEAIRAKWRLTRIPIDRL